MAVDRARLLRRVSALADRFSDLSAELAEAGRAILDSGALPAATLVDELDAVCREFESLREAVTELASGPLAVQPDGISGVRDLESVLRAIVEEDQLRARHAAEDTARLRREQDAQRRVAEEARGRAEDETRRRAEEQARRRTEDEARRRSEDEARRRSEDEARRQAEEEAQEQAEDEARRRAGEQARRRTEDEARRRSEEARHQADEAAKRRVQEQARQERAEEMRREEAEARRRAQEDARREAAEEARHTAEAAAARKAEEAARKAEEAARKAEEAARRKAEEAARRRAEEEERRRAQEDERRRAEQEARRQAEEEAQRKAAERARRRAEQEEARRRDEEEEARRREEEEARRREEEEAAAAGPLELDEADLETAQWWISASASWASLRARGASLAEAIKEALAKCPYVFSVPIQSTVDYEHGLLSYGYATLLQYVEERVPNFVTEALNRLPPRRAPLGRRLYEHLVTRGRLTETYGEFVKAVVTQAIPTPGIWVDGSITETEVATTVTRCASGKAGDTDKKSQRLTYDQQRYVNHRFAITVGPLTVRFVLVEASGVKEGRGVQVKVTVDGQPSDHVWLVLLQGGRVQVQRHDSAGTALPGLGKAYGGLWIGVFNPDPERDAPAELTVTLKRRA